MSLIPSSKRSAATLVRSLVATVETVGFATYVHSSAAGAFPGWWPTVALAAVVFGGAVLLLSRHATFWVVGAAVLGFQVLLHEGFSALAAPADHAATSMPDMTGMPGTTLDPWMSAHSGPMLLNHVVIGIVTLMVLACQDQALRALAGLVQLLVHRATPVLRTAVIAAARRGHAARAADLDVAPRRGPPVLVLLTP